MDKEITADWARHQATAILGERVSKEIEACEQAIKQAVHKNEMSCYVSIYAHQNTIKELVSRGFETKQSSDQREGSSLYIKW